MSTRARCTRSRTRWRGSAAERLPERERRLQPRPRPASRAACVPRATRRVGGLGHLPRQAGDRQQIGLQLEHRVAALPVAAIDDVAERRRRPRPARRSGAAPAPTRGPPPRPRRGARRARAPRADGPAPAASGSGSRLCRCPPATPALARRRALVQRALQVRHRAGGRAAGARLRRRSPKRGGDPRLPQRRRLHEVRRDACRPASRRWRAAARPEVQPAASRGRDLRLDR